MNIASFNSMRKSCENVSIKEHSFQVGDHIVKDSVEVVSERHLGRNSEKKKGEKAEVLRT